VCRIAAGCITVRLPASGAPEMGGALAATLPTVPAALALVQAHVIGGERVPFTAVAGDLERGRPAAFSILKWNHNRTISRKHAPATICNGLHPNAADCKVDWPPYLIGQR